MLGVNQLDFLNYTTAFKGNYRKGPHKLRAILGTPTQAQEFANNLGGVSVILSVPLDKPDRNSEELLTILKESLYMDMATETWLHGFYEFDALDDLLSNAEICAELVASAFLFRAVGASGVAVGKVVATLAGADCKLYDNIEALAASDVGMATVAASAPAMAAVIDSPTALSAVVSSSTAMAAVAASQTAMAAVIASPTALSAVVSSSTAMAAVAASSTAMAAIWSNETALQAVQNNAAAWETFTGASSAVMGKTAAILAGLNPDDYADMTAVAASSTAMAAVAASSTAMAAVAASSTAMAAVIASPTALSAVVSSSTAMAAVAASSTAMAAVAASSTAMAAVIASPTALSAVVSSSTAMAAVVTSQPARSAITASATAKTALRNSPLKVTKNLTSTTWVTTTTGRGWLIDYYQPSNPGGNVGWTIDGVLKAITVTGTTKIETWAVNSSSIYWYYSGSWATYIPC